MADTHDHQAAELLKVLYIFVILLYHVGYLVAIYQYHAARLRLYILASLYFSILDRTRHMALSQTSTLTRRLERVSSGDAVAI